MREIGSEFWDVPICGKNNWLFPKSIQWFISGRSALKAIISELEEAKSVALPSWCCDSMIKPFADAGFDIHFYSVFFNDSLIQEIETKCDVLFLMSYFGYTITSPDLGDYNGTIIRDVTHSLFSSHYSDADYYFGSLRKWCGIWTGGYAWTRDAHALASKEFDNCEYSLLREKAMNLKKLYIEGNGDKEYLTIFDKAEDCLERIGILSAANRDIQLALRIDVRKIVEQRRSNAEILRNAFADWLIFQDMKSTDCPMFVPILVPDSKRDELRRHLIQNEIYCPIHWPVNGYHKLNEQERFIYDNELSLVCDQRYTEEDMNRMVEIIKAFMER